MSTATTTTREPGRLLAERLNLTIVGTEGHDAKIACVCCTSSDGGRVDLEKGLFHCFVCKKGFGAWGLALLVLGNHDAAVQAMKDVGLFDDRPHGSNGDGKSQIVATYDYTDESGSLLYQVCRLEPGKDGRKKDFLQRKPKPGGGWEWTVKGCRLVPYRLPELLKCGVPLIVEGEGDVNRAAAIGIFATCNAMGAGKWKPEYNEYFRGKEVAIIRDNDQPGRDHGEHIGRSLYGIAKSVKIIDPPGVPEKGDLSDWLDQGHTAADLALLVDGTPEWTPPPVAAVASPTTPATFPPVALGTWVQVGDRNNWGQVTADNGPTCTVHFVSKEGQSADKEFPKSQLVTQDGKFLTGPENPIDYGLITAKELLRGDYTIQWLIPYFMARLQHMLWGGPLM